MKASKKDIPLDDVIVKNVAIAKERIQHMQVNNIKADFRLGDALLTTQKFGNELSRPGNIESLKIESATYFHDGKIYFTHSQQLVPACENFLYVMDKKGKLYISPSSKEITGAVHPVHHIKREGWN